MQGAFGALAAAYETTGVKGVAAGTEDLLVVLARDAPLSISGSVVDADRRAVYGALVYARFESGARMLAITSPAGTFELPAAAGDAAHLFACRWSEDLSSDVESLPPEKRAAVYGVEAGTTDVELVLPRDE
jgi:hypothetical protein